MFVKIKRILITTMLFTVAFAAVPAGSAYAATCGEGKTNPVTFFPAWYDGLLCKDNKSIKSPGDDSLGKDTSGRLGKWITIIAMNIVTMLLYVVGYVSLGFTIFGGFKYMISGDSSSGTMAARKTITNALIGLVLSIASVAIVKFVAEAIV